MRIALLAPLVIAGALAASPALADIGPTPSCGPGETHQYMYGHRCVPNGSHLEQDAEGHVVIVKDGSKLTPPTPPTPVTPPPPVATEAATAPPASTFATPPSPESPPPPRPIFSEPPHERGCACDLREPPAGLTGGAFALAGLLFAIARRRRQGSS